MLGRLRVLLILGLVVSPVTADLRDGLIWSEASAQNSSVPAIPLYYIYPWCTYGVFKSYDDRLRLIGTSHWQDMNYGDSIGTPSMHGCYKTMCLRHDWCISEAKFYSPSPDPFPSKITYGCVEAICITVRAVRPPPP
jgi:hypothetical protein